MGGGYSFGLGVGLAIPGSSRSDSRRSRQDDAADHQQGHLGHQQHLESVPQKWQHAAAEQNPHHQHHRGSGHELGEGRGILARSEPPRLIEDREVDHVEAGRAESAPSSNGTRGFACTAAERPTKKNIPVTVFRSVSQNAPRQHPMERVKRHALHQPEQAQIHQRRDSEQSDSPMKCRVSQVGHTHFTPTTKEPISRPSGGPGTSLVSRISGWRMSPPMFAVLATAAKVIDRKDQDDRGVPTRGRAGTAGTAIIPATRKRPPVASSAWRGTPRPHALRSTRAETLGSWHGRPWDSAILQIFSAAALPVT